MNILIIGASKGIGRQTVIAALAKGFSVTAFSRHPESLAISHPQLRLLAGDVHSSSDVAAAVQDHDVIVCALGLPTRQAIGPPFARRSYVLTEGTKHIMAAMDTGPAKRFICVTAIGTAESAQQCTPFARLALRTGLRWLFKEKDRQEDLIRRSKTDWTIIRPTALTNGRSRGAVITASVHSGILTHISRADVAEVILDVINKPETYRTAMAISYSPRLGDTIRWTLVYFGKG
jgi:uncharacterized protein YbjT (DUF2867 family)